MRKEVKDALYLVDSATQAGIHMLSESQSPNDDISKQASQGLTEQLEPYHDLARQRYLQLSKRLKQSIDCRSIYAFSSWGLALELSTHTEDEICIDITPYGSFVAVYMKGSIPDHIMAQVDNCISRSSLVRLTEQEVDELYNNGYYYLLF